MVQSFGSVPWRQVAESSLSHLLPPACRSLLIVTRYGTKQKVLLIQEVFGHVVLVVNVEIFYTGCDGMILVFNPDGECVRFGVAAEITAEQLVVEPVRRIHGVGVVHA